MSDDAGSHSNLTADPGDLVARYRHHLDGANDAEAQEILVALWQIMVTFVDLGYSVKAGDKFTADCDLGMADVLYWLHPDATAPETVAPENPNDNKETQ